ncbi:MAG: twin-arginine translocase subunit TatC [Campylobacterales bacterium]|nr:twin-arginine translocase subunit TatC [Campylobacterales bacterium]
MLDEIKPHLAELRDRVIKIFLILLVLFFACFTVWEPILEWVAQPLKDALSAESEVIAYKMGEQFITAVLVSFFAAFIIGLPFVFYQVWAFVAPGLYSNEKKLIIPFVLFGTIMFVLGALFAYYIVFPYGFTYLVNFGSGTVQAMISIGEYLGFFLKLMVGFGVSFELPVVCFFLAKMDLITERSLIDFFKYAIVIIFIFASLLTPPDIVTQFLMAIPLITLYGFSIIIVKIVNPYKEEPEF